MCDDLFLILDCAKHIGSTLEAGEIAAHLEQCEDCDA